MVFPLLPVIPTVCSRVKRSRCARAKACSALTEEGTRYQFAPT